MEKEKMIKTFKEMDFNILCHLNEAVDEYVENLAKHYEIDKELIVLNEVLCDSAMQRAKELINCEKELKEILANETFDNYELMGNSCTVDKYFTNALEDTDYSLNDLYFITKDLKDYLNRELYIEDAVDRDGNTLQIISNKEDNIIAKIYY